MLESSNFTFKVSFKNITRMCHVMNHTCTFLVVAMLESAKRSNPDVVHASVVEEVYNIREWIAPHLEEIHYHTEPHIFMFKKDGSGKAVMQYKFWSHNDWIGNCVLLKVSAYSHIYLQFIVSK